MEENKFQGILQIAAAAIIVALVLYIGKNVESFSSFGYLGVFIISLLSSATLFFPAPGWAAVIALSATLNPFMLGIAAGLGSGIGELTGFYAGSGAKKLVGDGRLAKVREFIGKNDLLAIFLFAFIPNPAFDIAGLAAGGMGIKVHRFLLPCIAGRVLRYSVLAYMGAFAQDLL